MSSTVPFPDILNLNVAFDTVIVVRCCLLLLNHPPPLPIPLFRGDCSVLEGQAESDAGRDGQARAGKQGKGLHSLE